MTIRLLPRDFAMRFEFIEPGLFLFGETLCFRSEYGDEAFVVESGEAFWGGTKTTDDRDALMCLPLRVVITKDPEPVRANPSEGG